MDGSDILSVEMKAMNRKLQVRAGRISLACLLGLAVTACDPGDKVPAQNSSGASTQPGTMGGPVIASDRWIVAPLSVDPFPDHQPPQPWECKPGSFRVENGSFEVETGSCAYGLFAQPLLVPVRAGQKLHMLAWHLILSSPEPAHGHMALYLGKEKIFEVSPQIPGPAASYDREIVVKEDHPPGEPVILHIHNHGINNWNLLSLETMDGP